MKLSPDDPKLTAYALGELDETERAAIELELRNSAECRQAVEEIGQMAGQLTSELASEPCPEPVLNKASLPAFTPRKIVRLPHSSLLVRTGLAALAASIVAIASWKIWVGDAKAPRTQFAKAVPTLPAEAESASLAVRDADSQKLNSKRASEHPLPSVRTIADQSVSPANKAGTDGEASVGKPTVLTSSFSTSGDQNQIPTPVRALSPAPIVVQNNIGGAGGGSVGGDGREQTLVSEYVGVSLAGSGGNKRLDSLNPNTPLDAPVAVAGQEQAGISDTKALSPSLDLLADDSRRIRSVSMSLSLKNETRSRSITDPANRLNASESGSVAGTVTLGWFGEQSPSPITAYAPFIENPFLTVLDQPLSTFSIDVDTASYANVRRFLNQGQLPPRDSIRIEEMINYFSYHYPQPKGDEPFAANIETAGCPWNSQHRLVRLALKGRELPQDKRPPSNFVFLIDVSGSMQPAERLPLIKQALSQLVKKMTASDRVAIVVYASQAGVRLASTSCEQKEQILAAIDALEAGGSTNGGEGIQQAYGVAEENFIKGGVNRVILCTDGDFNVGLTDQNQLIQLIKDKAKSGVFLTTLGVGTDNYKDALMQKLADKGNGNYHYLDTQEEAQKVLIEQMNATLVTIAKDVKIQIEFNPAQVAAYRLIGYEKRLLRTKDFNDDTKDAGEIGAGHAVTALYEIVPPGADFRPVVDNLKYQSIATTQTALAGNVIQVGELLSVNFAKMPSPGGPVYRERVRDDGSITLPFNIAIKAAGKTVAQLQREIHDAYVPRFYVQFSPTVKRERDMINDSKELLTLKLRYKKPDGDTSKLLEFPATDSGGSYGSASTDFRFAAAVASFGLILRGSEHKGAASFESILELADAAKGADEHGYRAEFINLVKKAKALAERVQSGAGRPVPPVPGTAFE